MRISFTGPSCSGKTTLLAACKAHYGDRFNYVEEVTRSALEQGLEINEKGNNKTLPCRYMWQLLLVQRRTGRVYFCNHRLI